MSIDLNVQKSVIKEKNTKLLFMCFFFCILLPIRFGCGFPTSSSYLLFFYVCNILNF